EGEVLPHAGPREVRMTAREDVPPADDGAGAEQHVAPRTPVEEVLAEIWGAVLGVERVGVHDNFFELGGDSILSVRIISRARAAGVELKPRDFFKFPTVAKLATVAETGIDAD